MNLAQLETIITILGAVLVMAALGGMAWFGVGELRVRAIRKGRMQAAGDGSGARPTVQRGGGIGGQIVSGVRRLGQQSAVRDPASVNLLRTRLMQAGFYNREAPVIYLGVRAAAPGGRHAWRAFDPADDRQLQGREPDGRDAGRHPRPDRHPRPRPGSEVTQGDPRARIFRRLPRPPRPAGGLRRGRPQPRRCGQPRDRGAGPTLPEPHRAPALPGAGTSGGQGGARTPGPPSPNAWASTTRASSPPCCGRPKRWAPAWARR